MIKRFLLACAASGLIGAALAGYFLSHQEPWEPWEPSAAAQPAASTGLARPGIVEPSPPPIRLTPEEEANIRVYEVASPGVVNINTSSVRYNFFFGAAQEANGSGSGSIIDKAGHILTNYHVVEDAQQIEVTMSTGKTFPGTLVGHDLLTDIAVLKIDAPADQLHPVALGTSDNVKVGQRVYALGNPFGLEGTLTTGIVSSLNRTLPSRFEDREMQALIQTDAAMNPGNSGGPLLDTSARMIGMNVAIATRTGQNAGVGFAIPVNRIRNIVPELIRYGKVVRGYIGIPIVNVTSRGLQIVKTDEDGPADKAGLRGGTLVAVRSGYRVTRPGWDLSQADYILAVDAVPVKTASAFIEQIEAHKPGEVIRLTILRDGRERQVSVTLGEA